MNKNRVSYIIRAGMLGLAVVSLMTYSAMSLRASTEVDESDSLYTQQPGDKPAEQVYKNIQIFVGVPASRVPKAMETIAASLGVQCTHCHVPDQFEKDDLPTKLNARRMFKMQDVIHKEISTDKVTCYTCHRGLPKPGPQSFRPPGWEPPKENRWADQGDKTAEQVFKNIQIFKGEKVANWMSIMTFMSSCLGVDCTFCHVPGAFEKDDKPAKQTARKMLNMVTTLGKQFYEKGNRISCYTCHRGKTKPEIATK
ncbi:MAG: photosynthetic reaction center cytochrome c subunit family protein [Blastocatellia bacterium]